MGLISQQDILVFVTAEKAYRACFPADMLFPTSNCCSVSRDPLLYRTHKSEETDGNEWSQHSKPRFNS